MCDGIDRAEHVETLPAARRLDPDAFKTPQKSEECAVHEMSRIDEKYGPQSRFRLVQPRLDVFF